MIMWIVVFLASLGWLFAFDHVVDPNPTLQWLMTGLALVVGGTFDRSRSRPHLHKGVIAVGAVACIVALFLAPAPYRPAMWTLLFGLMFIPLAGRLAGRVPCLIPWSRTALVVGALLTIQSPLYGIYSGFTARNPDVPHLADLVATLLAWTGMRVGTSGGVVYVETLKYTHALPLTWNHLASFPALLLWVAGAITLWCEPRRVRERLIRLSTFTAVTGAYVVVRFVVVFAAFISAMLFVPHESDRVHVEFFWLPWITTATFLPLSLVCLRYVGPIQTTTANTLPSTSTPTSGPTSPRLSRRRAFAAAGAIVVGVIGISTSNHYDDPGVRKPGRLLIDEAHSEWERSDRALDEDWYGSLSCYNYWAAAEFLGHHFQLDRNLEDDLTPERLADVDVLMLKTPTRPYAAAEIDAVEAFVRRGGGLFLMGEHSNVWGSSTYLNSVGRRFGLTFRNDCVFDIERRFEEVWMPPRHGRHGAATHVPFMQFAVSCSIDATDLSARPIARGQGLWTLPIDYRASNFYPRTLDHTYARFGAFDQAVAQTAGDGRVVVFSDSTIFSNFDAFYPGNAEFLLGTVEWLNRKNRFDGINGTGLVIGFLALVIGFSFLRGNIVHGVGPVVCAVAAAATWSTLAGLDVMRASSYPLPTAHTSPPRVAFDLEHGDHDLPVFGFATDYHNCFEVFYIWTLRTGLYPRVAFDADELWAGDDPVVLLQPGRAFDADERQAVRAYLERGGRLMVLDRGGRPSSTANQFLADYDMLFDEEDAASTGVYAAHPRIELIAPSSDDRPKPTRRRSAAYRTVRGGDVALVNAADEPVLAWKRIGKGMLIAGGIADEFSDPAMGGGYHKIPDRPMRTRYELEFALMRALSGGDMAEEISRLGLVATR